jgi:hypothetical protein
VDVLEIQPDFEEDPGGGRLMDFLSAQRAYERATSRRVALVHALALLGIPVWLAAAGSLSGFGREFVLALFVVTLIALLLAVVSESRWYRESKNAEARLRARRRTP